jgi:hypothetical protein
LFTLNDSAAIDNNSNFAPLPSCAPSNDTIGVIILFPTSASFHPSSPHYPLTNK